MARRIFGNLRLPTRDDYPLQAPSESTDNSILIGIIVRTRFGRVQYTDLSHAITAQHPTLLSGV